VLGPRLGARLADVRRELRDLPPGTVELAQRRNAITVAGVTLEPGDLVFEAHDEPGYATAADAGYTVAVTTEITSELADEGLAREIVRRIQDMRREAGFELSDRITTWYGGDADVARVMTAHVGYIQGETLSTELIPGDAPGDAHRAEQDLEGTRLTLAVKRN
jgi:isoleucyl-tRNA synthetase